jgi:hypothetical protein
MSAEFPGVEDQDQSEIFDEDNVEGVDALQQGGSTFEEIPDVYDSTQKVGDAEDLGEFDAADFDEDQVDDEDLEEEDEVVDEDAYDETDEEDVVDPDLLDRVAARGGDEVDLEYQPDVDGRRGARSGAGSYEARGELDRDDLDDLGYGAKADEEEEEEAGEDEGRMLTEPPDFLRPLEERSFARVRVWARLETVDDDHSRPAVEPLEEERCFDHLGHRIRDSECRQEALIDEAVEETFPASDPIAPKHIT